jgi:hypothetical protein
MITRIFCRDFVSLFYECIEFENKTTWFLIMKDDGKIIGYKCILSKNGSYNNIYYTKELHEFNEYIDLKTLRKDLIKKT